jgi:predicted component of type VI protein secretion system
VDLKLEGPPDVSREHCRIRRDAKTGAFFIRDLSQFGTTVNGSPLPKSVERVEGGEKVDRNREAPLPSPARITLADVCTLEFEAESSE